MDEKKPQSRDAWLEEFDYKSRHLVAGSPYGQDKPQLLAAISTADLYPLYLKHGKELFTYPLPEAIKAEIMACAKKPDDATAH